MNGQAKPWKLGAYTRRLILLPALGVGLSLAFAGAASAQGTPFQASVRGFVQKPRVASCVPTVTPNVAVFCGTATIAGYGPATWTLNVTDITPVTSACSTYTGTTTAVLQDGGGTLVLDETNGLVCSPGNSGTSSASPTNSFGHPFNATASWAVDKASSGDFAEWTGGGTDTAHGAGGQLMGTYLGTIVPPAS